MSDCPNCGYSMRMVYDHGYNGELKCGGCGYKKGDPLDHEKCPECGATLTMRYTNGYDGRLCCPRCRYKEQK